MLKRLRGKGGKKNDKLLANVAQNIDPELIWRKGRQIGQGAVGTVYQVIHTVNGMKAAAKVAEVENQDDLEEFVVEVDALKAMKNKNVVTLHAAYLWKSHLWLILDLCEGGAVDDIYLDRDRGLGESEIREIAAQVGAAVVYSHACGVYHRDIKAGNLLLQKDGTVKLADFGSCSIGNHNDRKRDTFVGSPYWMAPEMVECETSTARTTYDSKVDVWSFAITMIEL
eukprot:gene11207-30291_t